MKHIAIWSLNLKPSLYDYIEYDEVVGLEEYPLHRQLDILLNIFGIDNTPELFGHSPEPLLREMSFYSFFTSSY